MELTLLSSMQLQSFFCFVGILKSQCLIYSAKRTEREKKNSISLLKKVRTNLEIKQVIVHYVSLENKQVINYVSGSICISVPVCILLNNS